MKSAELIGHGLDIDDEHSSAWAAAIGQAWAADWSDPREDIYSLEDGRPEDMTGKPNAPVLSGADAMRIAHDDAKSAYGDISEFRISVLLQKDGWHIDYDLVEPLVAGGGPHYVIDPTTGAILYKRYDQ